MFLNKLKTITAVLLALGIVSSGRGLYIHQAGAQQRPADKQPAVGQNDGRKEVPGSGPRTVVVENVKLVLEPKAKTRLSSVKTPMGPRVRLEIPGNQLAGEGRLRVEAEGQR